MSSLKSNEMLKKLTSNFDRCLIPSLTYFEIINSMNMSVETCFDIYDNTSTLVIEGESFIGMLRVFLLLSRVIGSLESLTPVRP